MPLELSKDASIKATSSLQKFLSKNLEISVGNIAAGALLRFFLEEVAPTIYNKAVFDVQKNMKQRVSELEDRVLDLNFEIHVEEFQYWENHGK